MGRKAKIDASERRRSKRRKSQKYDEEAQGHNTTENEVQRGDPVTTFPLNSSHQQTNQNKRSRDTVPSQPRPVVTTGHVEEFDDANHSKTFPVEKLLTEGISETYKQYSSHGNENCTKSYASSKATTVIRKKKMMELEAQKAIAELEMETRKKLIIKEWELKCAQIDEEDEMEQRIDDVSSNLSYDNVASWLNASTSPCKSHNKFNDENESIILRKVAEKTNKQNSQNTVQRSDLQKFMARQTSSKDLPVFSGEAEEWPAFISHYRRSSEVCEFFQC